MNRRELLYAAGTTGVLAVAGCISDDPGNDDTGTQPSNDPDGEEGGSTDGSETGDDDGTDNEGENDGDGDEPAGKSGAMETARAFLVAFSDGDVDRVNALIHGESEMEKLDEEARAELEDVSVTVEDVELTEESEGVAVVAATLEVEQEDGSARTVPWELELRQEAEEWRVWERRPGDRSRIPGPTAEFDIEHRDGELTVRHEAGDTVVASELFVRGEGLAKTGSWLELGGETSVKSNDGPAVAAGDSVTVGAADEVEIRIVWNDGTDSKVFLNAAGAYERASDGEVSPEAPAEVVEYLSDANNFAGVVDATGESDVTVRTGGLEDDDGQAYAFLPAAIRVDVGTTVTWEWAGDTAHSVTHEGDAFDSGVRGGEGETFSHTFEDAGIFRYYCAPHKALGQKGAVIVGQSE